MKHRRGLFISIWTIALGTILLVSASLVGTFTFHSVWWFNPAYYEPAWAYYMAIGLSWSGVVVLIGGVFGIFTTFLSEYLDRQKKTPPIPPQS